MNFEEAIQKSVAEGAIRLHQLSDNLAYVYRWQDGAFQARGLYASEGNWRLGERLVAAEDYSSRGGWHTIRALPWQAKAIDSQAAKANPGYGIAIIKQCYTCKENKSIDDFSRARGSASHSRDWECDECFERRHQEMMNFKAGKARRDGDILNHETLAAPPPPASEI